MAIDPQTQALLTALSGQLESRDTDIGHQRDYYNGILPKIALADQAIPQYRTIIDQARTPWAQLIIDSSAERMSVTGFRVITPDVTDIADAEADALAWDIWQHSDCDTTSAIAFREMLLHGVAGVLVEDGDTVPTISFEHPSTTLVSYAPGNRGRVAAIKQWKIGDLLYAVVWTADSATTYTLDTSRARAGWTVADTQLATNRFGVVPLWEMRNRPDLLGNYYSDLDGLYPTIDRTIQTSADRLTAQLYSSVKVRYILGVDPELDSEGNPTQRTLKMAVDKLLLIEDPNAKAGQFEASDLRQFIECYRSDVSALASIARLPVHLLSGDLTNLSAEALKSIMEGLAARTAQRQVWAAPSLNGAMRLALRAAGDTRVNDPRTRVEVVWADVLPESLSSMAMAAQAVVGADVLSRTAAMEWALKLSPSQIEKYQAYRQEDAIGEQATNLTTLFSAPAA